MLAFYLAAISTSDQKGKFEYIYERYSGYMYKIACMVTVDPHLAEDAVHETFLQIIDEIDDLRIENEKELQSYLYIITKERTIDLLRKWERHKGGNLDVDTLEAEDYPLGIEEPQTVALTRLELEQALQIIMNMPEKYRRALSLRVKGYSIKEIAQITHCSEGNVKTRIRRARGMIFEALGKNNGDM